MAGERELGGIGFFRVMTVTGSSLAALEVNMEIQGWYLGGGRSTT